MYLDFDQFLKHNQNILNIKKAPKKRLSRLTLSNYTMVRMRGLEPNSLYFLKIDYNI